MSKRRFEDMYPLSPMQRGILFHALADPGSGAYVLQFRTQLDGLEVEPFEKAWRSVMERHAVLRTSFLTSDEPVQVVHREVPLPLTVRDHTAMNEQDHERWMVEHLRQDLECGFDLTAPPLFRLTLIRIAERRFECLTTLHHIILDGWSLTHVFGEVFRLYAAFVRGKDLELPASRRYRDYIVWLHRQDMGRAEAYWRGVLTGFDSPTEFRMDGSDDGRSRRAGEYAEHDVVLSATMTDKLRSAAAQNRVTLNTLTLCAWSLLLSRYSGSDDVVFGTTLAGRPAQLRGSDSMVGLLINTLPLRVRVPRRESVASWARQVQAEQQEQRQYEYAPLWEVQRWSPLPAGQRLFDSLYAYENYFVYGSNSSTALSPEDRGDLRIRTMSGTERTGYPVMLTVLPRDEMTFRLTCDRSRLGPGTAEAIGRHLRTLVEELADRPEVRPGLVSMLTPTERHQVQVEWNDTAAAYPDDKCIHELFEEQVERTPDAVAVVFGEETLTYGQLNQRANQLAHALHGMGVGPEDLVGLCMERSPGMVVALLGILKAGGAYVPLDPTHPRQRLAFILEDSGVSVLLTGQSWVGSLPEYHGSIVCLDTDWVRIAGESDADLSRSATPADAAYVIYTSGSTGQPKGVQVAHGGVVNFLESMRHRPGLAPDDVVLAVTTLSFDIAVLELFLPLTVGAKLIIAPRSDVSDGHRLRQLLEETGATVMQGTPATWQLLVNAGWEGNPNLKVLCGGEALSRSLADDLLARGGELWNLYGPTETTVWSAVAEVEPGDGSVSIGTPIDNTRLYVLDAHLRPVPRGVPGELFIGGRGLARGYHRRPDLTADRFIPDPFATAPGLRLYRTGDLARYRADGNIEFLGRVDHQVKLRGYRIELGEIEAVLEQHAAVDQAVAVVREDRSGDRRLVAYVVPANGASVGTSELQGFLKEYLPAYMVPSAVVPLASLPRTPNGKVDRQALPALSGMRSKDEAYVAPRNEFEAQVTSIWREVLDLERVGVRDNFFDLGGHSILLLQVHGRLVEGLGCEISVTDLFQYPTIASLVEHLQGGAFEEPSLQLEAHTRVGRSRVAGDHSIAVIAMAGRFPGAPDVETLWDNLRNGVESIHFFSDDELRDAGVEPALLENPDFVKARGVLHGADRFDAQFFDYAPREAELIDPQQRVFLECAWEALERAGYDPERYTGMIGVYAGASMNTYLANLQSRPELVAWAGGFQTAMSNDKDFLATRVSYKLNLRGPSVSLQTACSTSLVAIHEACRSLLDHRCDLAMAGGVSVSASRVGGYLYQEGSILSPDGHCRAFDVRAQGTLAGNGVGIVVLKRLDEALRDGDNIRAVIRGTATNNDGSQKVGFTAPSVQGQAEVISLAQAFAEVSPETIGYVEAHGTGTSLGDPIEVAALTKVFGEGTQQKCFCGLGSLKTNIGHLDTAAGVAGLIKTVLALEHRELPASLHFEEPNPEIDFANSPFYVVTECRDWETEEGKPRRAGVSSFGIGGTNAHAVLEEAPAIEPSGRSREWQLLVLSAKSPAALEAAASNLALWLREHDDADIADVAHTLQVGRREFEHRRAIACRSVSDAVEALEGRSPGRSWASRASEKERPVVFLFPGQGSQYVNMGLALYGEEPAFREVVDECFGILETETGLDLRAVLYPEGGVSEGASARLERTAVTQPALFVLEYALARLWCSWGIEPDACIGHSIGEYVAACLSGVLSLRDALRLVVERGRLMDSMPEGVMLAVPLAKERVVDLLAREDGLWLSAVNAPSMCVVSGKSEDVASLEVRLSDEGVACRRLHTSHAFHSGLMEDAVGPFVEIVRGVTLHAPAIPYLSNVTGDWVTGECVQDPHYWGRQIRQTVRFSDGMERVLSDANRALLEVGPGQVLGTLAKQQPGCGRDRVVVSSLRRPGAEVSDTSILTAALGRLWAGGVGVEWSRLREGERRRRVPLPAYPFQREQYWIERRTHAEVPRDHGSLTKNPDVGAWFYVPLWKQACLAGAGPRGETELPERWILFSDAADIGEVVAARLEGEGREVVRVTPGNEFTENGRHRYTLDPGDPEQYRTLLSALVSDGETSLRVVHTWSASRRDVDTRFRDDLLGNGFYSLLYLVQALATRADPVEVAVVTRGVCDVTGDEPLCPDNATLLGLCRVVPQEYPHINCRAIDIVATGDSERTERTAEQVTADLRSGSDEPTVAYRGTRRWTQVFDELRLNDRASPPPAIRDGGTYLITGGLGNIGLELAESFARSARVTLVLTGRSPFPGPDKWDDWIDNHDEDDPVNCTIRRLRGLEALGAEVRAVQADAADATTMREVIAEAGGQHGDLRGVVHAAGVMSGRSFDSIAGLERDACDAQFRAKLHGLRILDDILAGRALDFRIAMSSLSTVLGGLGMGAYASANAFMDAFACRSLKAGTDPWLSVDWDGWRVDRDPEEMGERTSGIPRLAMTPEEGVEAFHRVLGVQDIPQLVVSTANLTVRLDRWVHRKRDREQSKTPVDVQIGLHTRPDLQTDFVEPSTPIESELAEIWQSLLGIERVGIHDDFFDLGGHSLLATQLLNRLNLTYKSAKLSLRSVFDHPTVAGLAGLIDASPATAALSESDDNLRDRLLVAPAEARHATVCEYLTLRVANALSVEPDSLRSDQDLERVESESLVADLAWALKRDLQITVYAHEFRGRHSIDAMAEFVATELQRFDEVNRGEGISSDPVVIERPTVRRRRQRARVAGPRNPGAIFVLSAPRSGSTLLRLMLGGHPELFCPPELSLLRYDTVSQWTESRLAMYSRDTVVRAFMGFLEIDDLEDGRLQLADLNRRDAPVLELFRMIQARAGTRTLVDKSPDYAVRLETLERAEHLFEGSRYIHLVRHPFAVIESLIRNRIALLDREAKDDPYAIAERLWAVCNGNTLEFLGGLDPARSLRVRYEDLVREPARVMRDICSFLRIGFEQAMLDPYGQGRMFAGFGDPNILGHRKVEAHLGEVWKQIRLPRRLSDYSQELAEMFDYALSGEAIDVNRFTAAEVNQLLQKLLDDKDLLMEGPAEQGDTEP